MSDLHIARCSRDAAKYAVLNWHYSKTMPTGRLIMYGVWEDSKYIGAVIYGRGANNKMLNRYGLTQAQGCELVRVALTTHSAPVSQIVAFTLKDLRRTNPGLRIVISYADPAHGHHGGIYQSGSWLYLGQAVETTEVLLGGRRRYHGRSISVFVAQNTKTRPRLLNESRPEYMARVSGMSVEVIRVPPKHRYAMPLDRQMRRLLQHRVREYPQKQVS